jgi:hypothetical protein
MVRRNAQQLFQKKNARHLDDPSEKARKIEEFVDRTAFFREYSTRDFTMLFVESRDFLFYPPRDVGGSVFNPNLFRFSSAQELHRRPIHERDVP